MLNFYELCSLLENLFEAKKPTPKPAPDYSTIINNLFQKDLQARQRMVATLKKYGVLTPQHLQLFATKLNDLNTEMPKIVKGTTPSTDKQIVVNDQIWQELQRENVLSVSAPVRASDPMQNLTRTERNKVLSRKESTDFINIKFQTDAKIRLAIIEILTDPENHCQLTDYQRDLFSKEYAAKESAKMPRITRIKKGTVQPETPDDNYVYVSDAVYQKIRELVDKYCQVQTKEQRQREKAEKTKEREHAAKRILTFSERLSAEADDFAFMRLTWRPDAQAPRHGKDFIKTINSEGSELILAIFPDPETGIRYTAEEFVERLVTGQEGISIPREQIEMIKIGIPQMRLKIKEQEKGNQNPAYIERLKQVVKEASNNQAIARVAKKMEQFLFPEDGTGIVTTLARIEVAKSELKHSPKGPMQALQEVLGRVMTVKDLAKCIYDIDTHAVIDSEVKKATANTESGFEVKILCPKCQGKEDAKAQCDFCKKQGYINRPPCPECKGNKKTKATCKTCNGSGYAITDEAQVAVDRDTSKGKLAVNVTKGKTANSLIILAAQRLVDLDEQLSYGFFIIERKSACPICKGKGNVLDEKGKGRKCKECIGRGQIYRLKFNPKQLGTPAELIKSFDEDKFIPCPQCHRKLRRDAYDENGKKIEIDCTFCNKHGFALQSDVEKLKKRTCYTCKGTGKVCKTCKGLGEFIVGKGKDAKTQTCNECKPCKECKGTGKIGRNQIGPGVPTEPAKAAERPLAEVLAEGYLNNLKNFLPKEYWYYLRARQAAPKKSELAKGVGVLGGVKGEREFWLEPEDSRKFNIRVANWLGGLLGSPQKIKAIKTNYRKLLEKYSELPEDSPFAKKLKKGIDDIKTAYLRVRINLDLNMSGKSDDLKVEPDPHHAPSVTLKTPDWSSATCTTCRGTGKLKKGNVACDKCAVKDCKTCHNQGIECPACKRTGEVECPKCKRVSKAKCKKCKETKVQAKCGRCKGTGAVCDKCNGKKFITATQNAKKLGKLLTCPKCEGKGTGKETCPKCEGKGEITTVKKMSPCLGCKGKGKVGGQICPNCDGKKVVPCPNCDGAKFDCDRCKGKKKIECQKCGGVGRTNCPDCSICPECHGNKKIDGSTCNNCKGSGKINCDKCNNQIMLCPQCDGNATITTEDGKTKECPTCKDAPCPKCAGRPKQGKKQPKKETPPPKPEGTPPPAPESTSLTDEIPTKDDVSDSTPIPDTMAKEWLDIFGRITW